MSLFSRFFRKAPSSSRVPSPLPSAAPSDQSVAKASAESRALTAAAEEQALQSALDAGDVQAVARMVTAGGSTKLRQAAAQAINDLDLLRQLIREVRGGNDNNVYKILAAKRDALLEQARKQEQLRAELVLASEAVERHSQRPYDALYAERLDQVERRWNAIAEQADPALRDRVQQALARAQGTLAEHRRALAAQALRAQAEAEAAAVAEQQRERQAQAEAAAEAEQARALAEQRRALAETQQAERQAAQQIGELIRKARAALGEGNTSRAASIRRTIGEQLAGVSPLPDSLARPLQQLDKQLEELKDWKSFSVAPKRSELIAEMQLLLEASLDPLALAERIKSLQDEWRTLAKGVGAEFEADWQRFQEAAQKAYEPCKAYFAAQALVRQENLQRRDALVARFAAFEAEQDWAQPDWRAVINALRELKQEWRRYSDVDAQAARKQQSTFSALTARLQDRLDGEYARNRALKESLIERARQLSSNEDGRQAIDAIKALQQQWRTVGLLPRELDQRLWEEFRQHCDAVFQKRQQDFAAHTAGLEANRAQAVDLCEQVEQIAALEGAELLARAAALGELRAAFETLGELPRADTRELRNRFDRALERCGKSLARQQARAAEQTWTDLFVAADHARAYRLAVAQGLDQAQADALKQAAEACIASIPRWPKGGLDAIRQALADEPCTDLAANEMALKQLCIRAEILTEMPTPAEDQALRREYQLQRLVKGMGQRLQADQTNLDAMALAWIGVGPVEATTYAPLLQRFLACRRRGVERSA
ncbi:DUF349 domain-containing protein [Stagnimonas aquatica]|nr:DUF349 domain-containing protein [Stagnimonas aquatica]